MEIKDVRIITSSDQADVWNETIESAVYRKVLDEAGMKQGFKTFSAYAVLDIMPVLVGGIIVEVHSDAVWIDAIWVTRVFRRKGIGSELLNQATSFAIEADCNTMRLNTYFKDNLSFFKRNGFQEVACVPNWKYEFDCYLMSKTISYQRQLKIDAGFKEASV